jgi:Rad3-related DNA helicase
MRPNQGAILSILQETQKGGIFEAPTGDGKTALAYTILKAIRTANDDKGIYFFLSPNKAQVDQAKLLYPEFSVVYGRSEYDCLYYEDSYKADEIPCSLLKDCPHRVNQQTGETHEVDAHRCPYLDTKWKVKQGNLISATVSFYLFTALFSREWEDVRAVVVDEAHQLPEIIRNALSYEISDYHLLQIESFLKENGIEEYKVFRKFINAMMEILEERRKNVETLLNDKQLRRLLKIISEIDANKIQKKVSDVIKTKKPSSDDEIDLLKKLEMVVRDLRRYVKSFEFALESDERYPLNYVYGTMQEVEDDLIRYTLNIKCYYVAPIIAKIMPKLVVALSGTIGNEHPFRVQTGWKEDKMPFYQFESSFPIQNRKIFIPTDAADLSVSHQRKGDKSKTLRKIAKACRIFANNNLRSLVLVVSDEERQKFLKVAEEEGVTVVTYGNGIKAKEAARFFKEGSGMVLLGSMAQYGEGIDLPNGIAPIIFSLRPSYPPPTDPKAQFEKRRFGEGGTWGIWIWREMLRIVQNSGRNIRSIDDKGVTFCMSSQYRKFTYAGLPKWLKPAYVYKLSFEECIEDTLRLMKKIK